MKMLIKSAKWLIPLFVFACHHNQKKEDTPIDPSRFTKITLGEGLNEPYELAISKANQVFFIQRYGDVFLLDPKTNVIRKAGSVPVHTKFEDGLVGITLDPDFLQNGFVYMFYSPQGETSEYRVSRFYFDGDSILKGSEKIMLHIPSQREDCCHTGGSLAFDSKGNLFISIGDNTTPFKSNGYAPLDERQESISRDDQRTAANSNDLRGKILRIRPQQNGTYTIPEGNLFPKDGSKGRPEIFVMGNRNPFRISVDQKTDWLYWGEIGPDAGEDSERGPRGYDEINQARKAGNFGWPYFIADNKAYAMYNFENEVLGSPQNPQKPINISVNNTGTRVLPPAQKAFIYYPYGLSKEFPALGEGGRSAMAGPVYHYDKYPENKIKFPKGMDNVFFAYDWMRDWVLAVSTKPSGDLDTLVNYFGHLKFDHPMDIEFAPDGTMYMLEYGYKWWGYDATTKISRVFYERGNRTPVPKISVQDSTGPHQFKVKFSNAGTSDPDNDKLKYEWSFTSGAIQSREANPTYTFITPGVYYPTLRVTDPSGNSAVTSTRIIVGNRMPKVEINTNGNPSFYWDGVPLAYKVKVEDREEKNIKLSDISLSLKYLPEGQDLAGIGHQEQKVSYNTIDHPLINKSDCKACHQLKEKSVGPAFYDIAIRYKESKTAVQMLANKIIKGGGGNWGDHAMSAHPQISPEDATAMVKYILSVIGDKKPQEVLRPEGLLTFAEHTTKGGEGNYYFTASYTDNGNGVQPLTGYQRIKIRSPIVKADEADIKSPGIHLWGSQGIAEFKKDKTYIGFRNICLTDINNIIWQYSSSLPDGKIELRLEKPDGQLLASAPLQQVSKSYNDWKTVKLQLPPTIGNHDLYFVYQSNGIEKFNMMIVKRLYFNNGTTEPLTIFTDKK